MKIKLTALLSTCLVWTTASWADNVNVDVSSKYSEPTRGFLIEQGSTKGVGEASVELLAGSGALENGGGVRLGLSGGELIIQNRSLYAYDANELLLKWGLDSLIGDQNEQLSWAALGGLSYVNFDDDTADQTNLTLGITVTAEADAGIFTLAPKLIMVDSDNEAIDDTFFELDAGAYVGLVETQSGLFSVGVEAIITTADDIDNTFALGMRWLYNDHLTIDFVPYINGEGDVTGVPGLVRLNASF